MSGFDKGQIVLTPKGREGTAVLCYTSPSGENYCLVGYGNGYHETFLQAEVGPVPSTPLDANGVEIGVGDLVRSDGGSVGRVSKVRGYVVEAILSYSPDEASTHLCCTEPNLLTVLEKAPPPQITLGSRVRVKETGQEFLILEGRFMRYQGREWKMPGRCYVPEDELELIE